MASASASAAAQPSAEDMFKSMMAAKGQPSTPASFTFLETRNGNNTGSLIFLSNNDRGLRDLYCVFFNANPALPAQSPSEAGDLPPIQGVAPVPQEWIPLVSFKAAPRPDRPMSKEEELLRERMRETAVGVTSYVYEPLSRAHAEATKVVGRLLIPAGGKLYFVDIPLDLTAAQLPLVLAEAAPDADAATPGPKMDGKLSPDTLLVSYIRNNDIWIASLPPPSLESAEAAAGPGRRMTFSRELGPGFSAGVAEYIMQEEFDRYTGYWWCPVVEATGDNAVYKILYFEVDETAVPEISIAAPSIQQSVDVFKFPRPGETNAVSAPKVLTVHVPAKATVSAATLQHSGLVTPLGIQFPWVEYIPRAVWNHSPDTFILQLLDRSQKRSCVVQYSLSADMAALPLSSIAPSLPSGRTVLFETISPVWINVHNLATALKSGSLLWASEHTGQRHLYLLSARSPAPIAVTASEEWQVHDGEVWVDEERSLVYFSASKQSVLERHLYVAPLPAAPNAPLAEPQRLTEENYSHSVAVQVLSRTSHVGAAAFVVSVFSSLQRAPACRISSLASAPAVQSGSYVQQHALHTVPLRRVRGCVFPFSVPHIVSFPAPGPTILPEQPPVLPPIAQGPPSLHAKLTIPPAQLIPTLYGCVYLPPGVSMPQPGTPAARRCPTIVYVYGGPHVQLVTNQYSATAHSRFQMLAALGYVVAIADGRGSFHRGLAFEGHVHHRMGQVEIADQVALVTYLVDTLQISDPARVAITGWSYGGYATLLAMTQRPDVFKLGISCAPVVSWEAYDTGYTERYMDTPQNNPDGYRLGSVLEYLSKLPDEENRLMLVHGLIDENVHFTHTATLLNALVVKNKPYVLKVFPQERHGLRSQHANLYFERFFFKFLTDHL